MSVAWSWKPKHRHSRPVVRGERIGTWIVLEEVPSTSRGKQAKVQCIVCGQERVVTLADIRSNVAKGLGTKHKGCSGI